MPKTVAVIGAGLAGLAAAMRLSHYGFQVKLFEKNERPGGKMNEYVHEGFRFDTGPSLLTMPFVVDELFEFCGYNSEEFLNFVTIDPICRYFFPDNTTFDAFNDPLRMVQSVEKFAPGEVDGYKRFMAYSRDLYEIAGNAFLFHPIHEVKKMMNLHVFKSLLKINRIDAFRTMNDAVRSFFKDPRLIQIFNRYATYNGSDPFRAPATLNTIPYVEHELGSFYIKGGMYRLVEALESVAKRNGVEIFYSSPVIEIIHRENQILGVQTEQKFFHADYILCNMDVISAHNKIIRGFPEVREKLNKLEPSLAGMVFLWAVEGHEKNLAHHNILFSEDYRHEFDQLFLEKKAADDATVYVSITKKTDKGHAPQGYENWFVLVNMPYIDHNQDWNSFVEKTRKMVLSKLKKSGINLDKRIKFQEVFTPETFENRYNAHKGSIYGLSSNDRFSAFMRPANRSRTLKNLYFAGGSAHPGGGIPLVLISARFASELIAEKENLNGVTGKNYDVRKTG